MSSTIFAIIWKAKSSANEDATSIIVVDDSKISGLRDSVFVLGFSEHFVRNSRKTPWVEQIIKSGKAEERGKERRHEIFGLEGEGVKAYRPSHFSPPDEHGREDAEIKKACILLYGDRANLKQALFDSVASTNQPKTSKIACNRYR